MEFDYNTLICSPNLVMNSSYACIFIFVRAENLLSGLITYIIIFIIGNFMENFHIYEVKS